MIPVLRCTYRINTRVRVEKTDEYLRLYTSNYVWNCAANDEPLIELTEKIIAGNHSYNELCTSDKTENDPVNAAKIIYHLNMWNSYGMIELVVLHENECVFKLSQEKSGVPLVESDDIDPSQHKHSPEVLSEYIYMRCIQKGWVMSSPFSTATVVLEDLDFLNDWMTRDQVTIESQNSSYSDQCYSLFTQILDENGFLKAEDEGDRMKMWQFHDFIFHSRSRVGNHLGGYGGTYRFMDEIPPMQATKTIQGDKVKLHRPEYPSSKVFDALTYQRKSTRIFGDRPLSLETLSEFLFRSLHVTKEFTAAGMEVTSRPYPSGGAAYELEVYALINQVEGLERGIYHYDPLKHGFTVLKDVEDKILDELSSDTARTYLETRHPQIALFITSRFGRVAWKYESMAYALTIKHVGVLYQNFYLLGAEMKIGTCALGGGNSIKFSEATGIDITREPLVGEFILGSLQ